MEDLLGFILELLFEALFEIVLSAIVAGVYRSLRHFWITARRGNPIAAAVLLVIVGLALGFLSVLIFPHPLVHPSKVHGISLLISPLLAGLAMAAVGRGVRRRGRAPVRIESFGFGFAFAFAVALIRYLMTR
jgi:hypothetical protein